MNFIYIASLFIRAFCIIKSTFENNHTFYRYLRFTFSLEGTTEAKLEISVCGVYKIATLQ